MSLKRGEVCGVDNCDSYRWIEHNDGTKTCENGHTKERYQAGSDDEDYHLLGETTRRKREKTKKVSRSKSSFGEIVCLN
jgi:hypothetical protein